jgi:hypothetical protein
MQVFSLSSVPLLIFTLKISITGTLTSSSLILSIMKIEHIFKVYNISAAAYHGRKLNRVDCQGLICLAKPIFFQLETELLSVLHHNTCSDETIINDCQLHCDICAMLEVAAAKLRLKKVIEEKRIIRFWNNALVSYMSCGGV